MLRSHRFAAFTLIALAALVLPLLAGCSSGAYDLHFKGGKPLNVREGESRTVRVMLFYLKDRVPFEEASDEDLWAGGNDDVKGALVGDVVEFDVLPGTDNKWQVFTISTKDKPLDPEVKYVGVFAQFTDHGEKDRRADVIERDFLEKARVTFAGNSLTVEYQGDAKKQPEEEQPKDGGGSGGSN